MTENWLQEEYTIDTPENVSFGYEVAGIGSRFLAGLLDSLLIGLALFFLNIVLVALLQLVNGGNAAATLLDNDADLTWTAGLVLAVYTLLNFLIIWGYYVVFELIWNGQTPGKRWTRLRVVRVNGNPAGFLDVAIRNLVRIVDFLPTGYGVGLTVMFLNQQARRLGDYAAGTLVVKERSIITLENLGEHQQRTLAMPTTPELQAAWQQRFPALRRLSATDYDLIGDALARHDRGQITPGALHRLAAAVAGKLGALTPAPDWQASRAFLNDVSEAYRKMGS
ncbi:MAG: RDD family protein [Caldilineaceae bacterium]